MILANIGPDAPFYRAFTPRWAYEPESGHGAEKAGGRFNRAGLQARYLASTPQAALIEYQQESPLLPPATLAAFLVTAANVVDFTRGYQSGVWPEIWAEAYCNWKSMAFLEGLEPPSWVIGDLVREAGYPGILYRSAREHDSICLVLFPELAPVTGFRATVYDPREDLPRNAVSWIRPQS